MSSHRKALPLREAPAVLCLAFHLRSAWYAVPATEVVHVLPRVELRPVEGVGPGIAGLMMWEGAPVPVVDLEALMGGQPCPQVLGARIVLVQPAGLPLLGLLVAWVQAITLEAAAMLDPQIHPPATPYLGALARHELGLVQCVRPELLLDDSLRAMLGTQAEGSR
jgi:chemotaxis-related protein WspB